MRDAAAVAPAAETEDASHPELQGRLSGRWSAELMGTKLLVVCLSERGPKGGGVLVVPDFELAVPCVELFAAFCSPCVMPQRA